MATKNQKLDGYARRLLESNFKARQETTLQAQCDALTDRLVEVAVRRLKATYDAAQADMPTLEKYHLCTQVEAVNFRVYDPITHRWEMTVGTKVDLPGYMIPGSHSGYVSLYLGGHAAGVGTKSGPYPADADHESPDWKLACEIVMLRDSYRRDQEAARKAFAVEIRATSSWNVLAKAHPWIDEAFPSLEEVA